jgi:hypothetical protein
VEAEGVVNGGEVGRDGLEEVDLAAVSCEELAQHLVLVDGEVISAHHLPGWEGGD